MTFKVTDSNLEVDSRSLGVILKAFNLVPAVVHRILVKYELGVVTSDGKFTMHPVPWYPLTKFLSALDEIEKSVGPKKLREVGKQVSKEQVFDRVLDIHESIRMIDVGYHLYHRKSRQTMFDLQTGTMFEGIGHYGYTPVPGANKIISECKNPYPCGFDWGILWGSALRTEARAIVEHVSKTCRNTGADACTYEITW
jgi:hypothetical protein